MDLEQKFIEENRFEIGEEFLLDIEHVPVRDRRKILMAFVSVLQELPMIQGWTQSVAGVIKRKNPLFYEIEFLKDESSPPLLLGFKEIGSDEYLDMVLESNTIEYYEI